MNIVLTGCDVNTEWQLPWFLQNVKRHNPNITIVVADFGMSDKMKKSLTHETFVVDGPQGWFKKPRAMIQAAEYGEKVVWLDTDCEVRGDVSYLFDNIHPEMLSMGVDRPMNRRHPHLGTWYNSGVVGFTGTPQILIDWELECRDTRQRGDQEVLHVMFKGNDIVKSQKINPYHHRYNTLRIDIIDGVADPNPVIMHWTGPKGNLVIKGQMSDDPLSQVGIR